MGLSVRLGVLAVVCITLTSTSYCATPSLNFNLPFASVFNGNAIPRILNWTSVFSDIPALLSSPSSAPAQAPEAAPSPEQGPAPTCPPPGYSPLSPFDLESFISDYWYIQQQAILYFSPRETLYCCSSHYVPINEFSEIVPFKKNGTNFIDVRNYANYGKVNGQAWGTSGSGSNTPLNFITGQIFFKEVATSKPGNPAIALPAFYPAGGIARSLINLLGLTQLFQAPYGELWILDAGPGKPGDPDFQGYEWAILTSGSPDTPSNGACSGATGNFGYWLFTRAKVASSDLIAQMRKIGAAKGLDNSILVPVQQEGCLYDQRT